MNDKTPDNSKFPHPPASNPPPTPSPSPNPSPSKHAVGRGSGASGPPSAARPRFQSEVNADGASLGTNADLGTAAVRVLAGETLLPQPLSPLSHTEMAWLWVTLRQLIEKRAAWFVAKAARQSTILDQIFEVLRLASIMTGRTGFNDPVASAAIRRAIETATRDGRPLALAIMMGGGKAPNRLKTGGLPGPDLAELISLVMLAALVRAIRAFHPPGVRLIIVPDSVAHTADIAFPLESAILHLARLRAMIDWLGASEEIEIVDPLPLLGEEWIESIDRIIRVVRTALDAGDPAIRAQVDSLVYSVNSDVAANDLERDVLVYATLSGFALRGVSAAIREEAAHRYRRAEEATPHYVAVNQSIRDTRLVERAAAAAMPDGVYLRGSVHAKPGEWRPMLIETGRYAKRPGLLPMHAMGVLGIEDDRLHFGLVFHIAAIVRCWTPVVDPDGQFLFWRPAPDGDDALGADRADD